MPESCNERPLFHNAVFILWLVGGAAMVAATCQLTATYYKSEFAQTFRPVQVPPDYETRRFLYHSLLYFPWVVILYALVGLWFFRRRGCLGVVCAAAIGDGSIVIQFFTALDFVPL